MARCAVILSPDLAVPRDDLAFCPADGTVPVRLPSGRVIGHVCLAHTAVASA